MTAKKSETAPVFVRLERDDVVKLERGDIVHEISYPTKDGPPKYRASRVLKTEGGEAVQVADADGKANTTRTVMFSKLYREPGDVDEQPRQRPKLEAVPEPKEAPLGDDENALIDLAQKQVAAFDDEIAKLEANLDGSDVDAAYEQRIAELMAEVAALREQQTNDRKIAAKRRADASGKLDLLRTRRAFYANIVQGPGE